jgi:MFS transporter, FLVCR family, MFS-domain-containing protein 7
MASPPETSGEVNATEKQTDAQKNDKNEVPANDKVEPEPVPGGWTFLRTMKMRGLKGRSSGSAAAPSAEVSNVSNGKSSISSKDNDELKVTQTNGSGDGPGGVGEIEALHEVRSDDELLGGEAGASPPSRPAGTQVGGNLAGEGSEVPGGRVYKVYKRRWFGLVQLVLLNIIVSWDVSSLSKSSQPQMSLM